eukprot:TRINITY_DN2125_c0_g2_i2.p1 TRINITY_DN2125_c0_g2~~TRINITY_DN2125_c0_g2_i2.p1  ORF type:complete len:476 (-),score=68.07 TRINITY_DN2125_c0_g2_i2:810-2237(-)
MKHIITCILITLTWITLSLASSSSDDPIAEGTVIATAEEKLALIIIIGCIIFFSVGMEILKEIVEEKAFESMKNVISALWGELAVVGILSLTTFVLGTYNIFYEFSNETFGDPEFIDHEIHVLHLFLFLVFIIFVIEIVVLLIFGRISIKQWEDYELDCYYSGDKIIKSFINRGSVEDRAKMYYFLMRKEFIRPRDPTQEQLSLSFNFGLYLSMIYGHKLSKIVNLHPIVWIATLVLFIFGYALSFASVLVQVIVFTVWNYLLLVCVSYLVSHMLSIRRQLVPYRLLEDLRHHTDELDEDLQENILNDFHSLGYLPEYLKLEGKKVKSYCCKSKRPLNAHEKLFWFGTNAASFLRNMCSSLILFQAITGTAFVLYYYSLLSEITHDDWIHVIYVILNVFPVIPFFIQIIRFLREIVYTTSIEMMKQREEIYYVNQKSRARKAVVLLAMINSLSSFIRRGFVTDDCARKKKKKVLH